VLPNDRQYAVAAMKKTKRDTDSKQSIQTLFLQPAESYELREVAQLTDTPVRTLRREVARGGHDATKVRGQWRFAWRQAAYVAMQRWTLGRYRMRSATPQRTFCRPCWRFAPLPSDFPSTSPGHSK
jgi:hypothetical protein